MTRYGMVPLYAGCAFTVKRPLVRIFAVPTVRQAVAPYRRCRLTEQLDGEPETVPFTGTIAPTGALVFDGVAETTTGWLTNNPSAPLGAGSPGSCRQFR